MGARQDPERVRPMPGEVTIRGFTMADYEAVLALWTSGGSGVPPRPSDRADQIRLRLERDPDLFLVAEAGGRLVAAVLGGWDGRRAYLYHLAVAPDMRRRGIASRLMDELEERFRARGAMKAKCEVLLDNIASLAFFYGRGYLPETATISVGKELVPGGAPRVTL